MIKIFRKMVMGEFPQLDKEHLQKPTANIIFNYERPTTFP